MRWWWLVVALLVPAVAGAGKGRKHKHQKPGRAVLDRLASTTLSEPAPPADSASSGPLPAPLDAAPYSVVEASHTCGEDGVEDFCREMPGKRGIVCGACEGPGGAAARQHPASHAVDGDPATWWQSPTHASGDQYKHVDLIATLPAMMELLHVIIKSGPSPRPLAWSLEVSSSAAGDDWRLLRAFGDKEHCRKLWALRPERRRRRVRRGTKRSGRADKPTCSTQFASPRPLENGEMHVGLGAGVAARRLRISLRGAHSADADRQYYTVRALTLAARCLCHGHATECTIDREGAQCQCLHGACGDQCSRCCDGSTWAPSEPCAGEGGGEDCACAERGECLYDDTGAILCVNCTENRAGPLCDRCLPGYYSATSDGPCLPCDCNREGSDGTCKYSRKHRRVSCACREGVTGEKCDACADAAAVFPACDVTAVSTERCRCDQRGVVDPERVCDDVCECKANVVGSRCDTCAPGHYGLSASLVAGCRPCYCSGVGAVCAPDAEPADDMALPRGEGAWLVTDAALNQTLAPSVDDEGRPYLISYEVEGWDTFYWSTTTFSGEQWDAYGGQIRASLTWAVVRGDTGGNPTSGPDAMLIARDGTKLASMDVIHETPGQTDLAVPLTEEYWFLVEPELEPEPGLEPEVGPGGLRQPVTRFQFMEVLKDVRALMIRAHYHLDQDEVRLDSGLIAGAAAGVRGVCSCPAGYAGGQCGVCAHTHVRLERAPGAAPAFECAPCACHGHAGCTAVDGPCDACQHNTTGPHCERCLPGHYGNPVQGGCAPCACPLFLASNNFSPLCALSSASPTDYVCTQCPDGHSGDHCELCDFGYWGSPTTPGSKCVRCACGGAPCDVTTGDCLACEPNARCDHCEEGYYLSNSTSGAACVKCQCGVGALTDECDALGRCACRRGWASPRCDSCEPGHYDPSADCPQCRCALAALSTSCDASTGACACAEGAAPPHCADCLPEHWGLQAEGCAG